MVEALNEEIRIKDFEIDNIDKTFLWVKGEDFKNTFLIRGKVTQEGNLNYFSTILKDKSQKVFAIYAGNQHIGNCGLKNIDKNNQDAELWIYIGDENSRGKGWGKQALHALLNYGFYQEDCIKIILHVVATNAIAIKMYKEVGFVELDNKIIEEQWVDRQNDIKKMELYRDVFQRSNE